MMRRWKEFEITNFLGRQERVTPDKNSCSSVLNLDPRGGDQGVLLMRPKVEDFLTLPTDSTLTNTTDLGIATMYITQLGSTPKEVNVFIQKGTVNKISGSTASIASKNVVAVWVNPYWWAESDTWVSAWDWLNKITISHITAVPASGKIQIYGLSGSEWAIVYSTREVAIYNVTRNEYATVAFVVSGVPDDFYITNTGWNVNDTVILMKNFFPLANLEANYSATNNQVNFHHALNDLRIGFGGYSNRLGMGVGYRKKYFNIASMTINSAFINDLRSMDQIISGPYNNISENTTFNINISRGGTTGQEFPYAEFKSLYVKVTAVLDEFQEFELKPVDTTCEIGDEHAYTMVGAGASDRLLIVPKVHFATMNKRITHLKFYAAQGAGSTDAWVRKSSYYLVKTIEVANTVAAKTGATGTANTWVLGSDGYLALNTTGNSFEINYDMWLSNEGTIQDQLGYKPTYNYVTSWDQALMTQGRIYYLNPYVDQRYINKIMRSALSGFSELMYDVVTASDYSEAEQRNGDDVVGMELLANLDIALFKQNSIQQLDTQTGGVFDFVSGVGCVSRRSIVNFRDKIIFASRNGVYVFDGTRAINISDGQIKSLYDAIPDKTAIVAVRDELSNCYRFYDGTAEHLFVEGRGWFYFNNGDAIKQYVVSNEDNLIRYLTTSKIRKITNTRSADSSESLEFVTGKIDIGTIGTEIKASDRFLLGRIWAEYKSARAITFSVYLDNGLTIPGTLPIRTTVGIERARIGVGHTTKNLKMKVATTLQSGDTDFELHAFGIEWDISRRGLWG